MRTHRCSRARLAVVLALVISVAPAQAQEPPDGRKLFGSVTPSCALCHTLKDAGAAGEVGPSLDELKPDAGRVVKALRNGIGQMPAFRQLSDAQVNELARYIEKATR